MKQESDILIRISTELLELARITKDAAAHNLLAVSSYKLREISIKLLDVKGE